MDSAFVLNLWLYIKDLNTIFEPAYELWVYIAYAWICSTDLHGWLVSGARCLYCVMSVHLDPFFVCASSDESGQCAHMCGHTCTQWPESSLLVHTKNVCTCVHASAHTCAQILCEYECTHVHTCFVFTNSEYSGQCAHACTIAWAFFMETAIINNIWCAIPY